MGACRHDLPQLWCNSRGVVFLSQQSEICRKVDPRECFHLPMFRRGSRVILMSCTRTGAPDAGGLRLGTSARALAAQTCFLVSSSLWSPECSCHLMSNLQACMPLLSLWALV